MKRLIGAVTVNVLLVSTAAWAAIPAADGTISACFHKQTGQLRVIDAEAGEACRKSEVPITLQQAAPAARLTCPSGTTLSTGVCIENAARTPASQRDASLECAAIGRRLPSGGELTTFTEASGITVSPFEWTDDLGDTNVGGAFHFFVVGELGNARQDAFVPTPYRCVAGPEVQ